MAQNGNFYANPGQNMVRIRLAIRGALFFGNGNHYLQGEITRIGLTQFLGGIWVVHANHVDTGHTATDTAQFPFRCGYLGLDYAGRWTVIRAFGQQVPLVHDLPAAGEGQPPDMIAVAAFTDAALALLHPQPPPPPPPLPAPDPEPAPEPNPLPLPAPPIPVAGGLDVLRKFPDLCPQPLMDNKRDRKLRIKVLAVFGDNGEEVIVVTTYDIVFGFGANRFGRLGLGVSDAIERPQLNATLTGKKIMKICYGLGHCLGLTSGGQCYGWGHNASGQIGIGSIEDMPTPQPIKILSLSLNAKPVTDISCGDNHSLVLTIDGLIYSFGANDRRQCGQTEGEMVWVPTKVTINVKFVSISCGRNHSSGLTDTGTAYVWGSNDNKQLGPEALVAVGLSYASPHPFHGHNCRVFRHVICGPEHTVLMTRTGIIHVIGWNGWKADPKNSYLFNAIKVRKNIQFKRIDTTYDNRVVIVTAPDGQLSILGKEKHWPTCTPIDIPIGCSLFDVCAKYCGHNRTFASIVDSIETSMSSMESCSQSDEEIYWSDGEEEVDIKDQSNVDIIAESDDEIYFSDPEEVADKQTIHSQTQLLLSLDLLHFGPHNGNECHKSRKSSDNAMKSRSCLTGCGDNVGTVDLNATHSIDPIITCFQKHLFKSFDNRLDSDLRFKAENKSIYCHKTVLKIRNKEFWEICEQNMINESDIEINAYSYDTIKAFLMFLYGLRPEVNDQNCRQLLGLAVEYGERGLKDMCCQYL